MKRPVRFLLAPVRTVWVHRQLVRELLRRELSSRYRGSYLGIFWSFLTPLVTLVIYTFVFSVVLKARWRLGGDTSPPTEYALALFAGLIPFNLFSEVVARSPSLVLGVPNYVKKVVFPLEVLPLVTLLSAFIHSLIGVGILLVANVILRGSLSPFVVLLPLAYVPLLLLGLASGWVLSSLGVYVRDVGQGIPLFIQCLLFLSAVVYPVSAVPERMRFVLEINPLTTILEVFRDLLLWGHAPSFLPWAAWTIATFAFAWLAFLWFMKTKKGFADVL